ncbi:MAG: DUF5615 family PIN-like protein [Abitibacteriaceae bacterium]|nr:DUF5615 family PIN-like protein [Abditibacteriaceae bacterium]
MNLLCDENIDQQIVEQLRADGHHVLSVAEMEPGITDDIVLHRANEHIALLVTQDKDFGELVYRQNLVYLGVILVRLHGLSIATKAQIVSNTLNEHGGEMPNAFTVISPGIVRIRRELA